MLSFLCYPIQKVQNFFKTLLFGKDDEELGTSQLVDKKTVGPKSIRNNRDIKGQNNTNRAIESVLGSALDITPQVKANVVNVMLQSMAKSETQPSGGGNGLTATQKKRKDKYLENLYSKYFYSS